MHGWITPGDWANSRMNALMQFENGPMFRVFTDDEIALWAAYTESLAPPTSGGKSPTRRAKKARKVADRIPPDVAMAKVIDQLRPVQCGISGHRENMLADLGGKVHSLSSWFDEQPSTLALMQALASPLNGLITPGKPEDSRFYMELIAPAGPMGTVFDLAPTDEAFAHESDPPRTCREVVHRWITEMPFRDGGIKVAGIVGDGLFTLRFGTPPAKRDRHPTGRMYGMGAVH